MPGLRPILSHKQCRYAAGCIICLSALFRLLYLAINCPIDLVGDEAHYWDWSRHLDWSYYSKGPLVAWIIRLSCEVFGSISVSLTGSEMLAVRLPAVLFSAMLLVSLYILTVQTLRRETLALGVVAAASTIPLISAGAVLMTIDAPYVCIWGWALVAAHRAVFRAKEPSGRRTGLWIWLLLGFLIGTGILAKYTMILFVPFLGLFLLATPSKRMNFRRPGFWAMSVVSALCCLPILIWNWQHDWVTLRHTAGQVGIGTSGDILGPFRYVTLQFGILLGFWFIAWAAAIWKYRPWRQKDDQLGYLWWLSAPMFVFFLLFSFKDGGGEPNWPVTAYLSGSVLAALFLAEELKRVGELRRKLLVSTLAGFCLFGILGTVVLYRSTLIQPLLERFVGQPGPGNELPLSKVDPSIRLRGWKYLASEVDLVRAQLEAHGIDPVIVSNNWSIVGELAFYCHGHPDVYTIGTALGDRHSQYDIWRPNPVADPEAFAGRTMIIVGGERNDFLAAFDEVGESQTIQYFSGIQPIAQWNITVGRGFDGFPNRAGAAGY
ncbi:MAG: glycosyltransferase family 39 protein [Acidobacteria bacterium]|nr:glycosyltransferase family 39 protein [Acidobacteriota bacterium]